MSDDLEKTMCDGNGRVQRWTMTSMVVLASSMVACGRQTIADECERELFWRARVV